MNIEKGKASPQEEQKLIEEIKHLIKAKGLRCNLEVDQAVQKQERMASGCEGCTICPCMICW